MGLLDEPETELTGIHRELTRLLAFIGFDVEDEKAFPPYQVDCYVEELHVAFEADGPQHRGKADRKRDSQLLACYALPVVRVTSAALEGSDLHKMKMLARSILRSSWLGSADQRREFIFRG